MPILPTKQSAPVMKAVSKAQSIEVMTEARNFLANNKSSLVIDGAKPYKIMAASDLWLQMFGFSDESYILRRSLNLLQGPNTNSVMLNAFLSSCNLKTEQNGHFKLYLSNGQAVMIHVSARRYLIEEVEVVVLEFEYSNAILPHEAELERGGLPMALVEVAAPFRIIQTNQEFLELSGYNKMQVSGRALCMLQGPGSNSQELARMFKETAKGTEQEGKTNVYNCSGSQISCNIRLSPVAAADGKISHVLLQLVQEVIEALPQVLSEDHISQRLQHNKAMGFELMQEARRGGAQRLNACKCHVAVVCDRMRGNRCPARALYNIQTGKQIQESIARRRSISCEEQCDVSTAAAQAPVEQEMQSSSPDKATFVMYLCMLLSFLFSMVCQGKKCKRQRRNSSAKEGKVQRQFNAWIYLDEQM